jgi:hypothetical protein
VVAGELLTSSAFFALAGQFTTSAYLDDNKFPSLIEDCLDMLRNVDDSVGRNDFVVAEHVSIKQLVKPKGILLAAVVVHVGYLGQVLYVTFATYGIEWTRI